MSAAFGSTSTRAVEVDLLDRPRRRTTIWWDGLGEVAGAPQSFDSDDLELLLRGDLRTEWAAILGRWTPEPARAHLPWAVAHHALDAPVVRHRHEDAVCAMASTAGARSLVTRRFGPGVVVLPYGVPGPELGRRLAAARAEQQTHAAVVPHLGLFVWGETEPEVAAACEAIEAAAIDWMLELQPRPATRSAGASESYPGDTQEERLLLRLRGSASQGRRVVLSVDPSLAELADRRDLEPILEHAPTIETTWPWGTQVIRVHSRGEERAEPGGTGAWLAPGLGLVTSGEDEAAAAAAGVVAAHTLRVAAFRAAVLEQGDAPVAADPFDAPRPAISALEPGAWGRGRVYIVTGAASGIGRDVARHLASLGASLALADLNGEALDRTADELEPLAGRPLCIAGDLTDEQVVERLVRATVRRFGGVDGAVLNAGIALPGEVRSLSEADWSRSLGVNVTSHFLLAKRLLPVLETQKLGGSLVFIGSKNMFSPGAGFGAYSASKAALAQLARVVAIEAGPIGVRSNIVNPDNVFAGSALWSPELRAQRAAVYGIRPEDLEAYYTQRNLMKVPITGEDIARGVAFLLSDDAMRTTACVLTVDGGVPGVFPR